MNKYDRQIRLWDLNGQSRLATSRLCLFGDLSTYSCEILQNLILPGLGHITMIDLSKNQIVDQWDLNSNFFLKDNDVGKSKADCMARNLNSLNDDVTIVVHKTLPETSQFWSAFDIVVYIPPLLNKHLAHDEQLMKITDLLYELDIPIIKTSIVGFYSYLKIQTKELNIIETHDPVLNDLRIDTPWKELLDYVQSFDLRGGEEYFQVPFSIILTQLYSQFIKDHGIAPNTKQLRDIIHSLHRTGDELNILEAYNKAYLIMRNSKQLPLRLKDLFEHPNTNLTVNSSFFWVLVKCLKSFYENFETLPLHESLPDMESNTQNFTKLRKIYQEKANNDRLWIKNKCISFLHELRRTEIPDDDHIKTFIKNCRHLKLVQGSKTTLEEDLVFMQTAKDDQFVEKSLIYLGLLLAEKYLAMNSTYPVNDIKSEFRSFAIASLKSESLFPNGLDKVLDEICRSNLATLHNICAIMGGIVSQEVIKFITGQYVPVENVLVFDGIKNKTTSFKM